MGGEGERKIGSSSFFSSSFPLSFAISLPLLLSLILWSCFLKVHGKKVEQELKPLHVSRNKKNIPEKNKNPKKEERKKEKKEERLSTLTMKALQLKGVLDTTKKERKKEEEHMSKTKPFPFNKIISGGMKQNKKKGGMECAQNVEDRFTKSYSEEEKAPKRFWVKAKHDTRRQHEERK